MISLNQSNLYYSNHNPSDEYQQYNSSRVTAVGNNGKGAVCLD